MPTFVSHVLTMSASNPRASIKNICLKESGKPVTRKKAGNTAARAVRVMKIPVRKAEKILLFSVPSLDFRAREVRRMSVSTL